MVQTRSQKLKMATDSQRLVLKESDSISECFIDVTLPQELITEILVRLPVKSLLRFKCVSKPWLSLISNPQFIRSHFSKSSSSMDELENVNLQLLFSTSSGRMKQFSLNSALLEADPSTHLFDNEFPCDTVMSLIVGIVNGLVCIILVGSGLLFLWNPVLKKVTQLPALIIKLEEPFNRMTYSYSFGYDESVDDYKVVCLLRRYTAEFEFEDQVKVYSLQADSWGTIHVFNGGFRPMVDPGLYANSKIYWLGNVSSSPNMDIVSLDMVSDKFGVVQHPNYEAGDYDLKLGVLSGQLCVLCDYQGRKADLWVLDNKNNGAVESWCKMLSIPYGDVHPQIPYSGHQVLCILSNYEIVLANAFGLLVYSLKNNEFRMIELDIGILSHKYVAAYVESLVWPDSA